MSEPLIAAGFIAIILSRNSGSKAKVLHAERAARVNIKLIAFLDWWQANGTFDILVAPDGGLRSGPEYAAKQLEFFRQGLSNAATLAETPHGRGAALDLWPVSFDPNIPIPLAGTTAQPIAKQQFYELGEAGEKFGLRWGGRWTKPYDLPHFEVLNWRTLPMVY